MRAFIITSVLARWRVPYAVEENLRGMTERKKDKVSGFLLLDVFFFRKDKHSLAESQKSQGPFKGPCKAQ